MVDKLCGRLQDYQKSGRVVPLRQAYKSFAADVVAEYCFAENGHLLEYHDFAVGNWKHHEEGLHAGLRARYLPQWYLPTIRKAPGWIQASIDPAAKHFEIWHRVSPLIPSDALGKLH